ncbi:hypothetical protein G9A89_012663 [Geosiphon pyriformis]|nr:hypothetical protein G9A89_012663 [Geosiphon pyriformis]
MAYAPIAKLEKFTGKDDDAQVWLNDVEKAITVNRWNNTRALQTIPYFLQDIANSWYQTNTFTTIKQRKTEAVTTYLGCFHRNLCQIQAIQADYFTVPQILNQFICELHSSLLQRVCPMHPQTLQDAVTNTRDFELAELEANHAQAINLVMNRSSDLDSKLKQLSDSINQKLEGYLADNYTIYQPPQQYPELSIKHRTVSTELPTYDATAILSTTNLSADNTSNLSTTVSAYLLAAASKITPVLLFSGAALDTKLITAMYTDTKVDGHQVDRAVSAHIITADRATKTPIGKIDNLPIEVNNIIVSIKALVIEATQY